MAMTLEERKKHFLDECIRVASLKGQISETLLFAELVMLDAASETFSGKQLFTDACLEALRPLITTYHDPAHQRVVFDGIRALARQAMVPIPKGYFPEVAAARASAGLDCG